MLLLVHRVMRATMARPIGSLPILILVPLLAVACSIVCGASGSSARSAKESSSATTKTFSRVSTGNPNADAMMYKAFELRRKGELEKAEKQMKDVLKKYPTLPELHRQLSYTFVMERKVPEAFEALRTAAHLEPQNYETWQILSQVSLKLKDLNEAEFAARKAYAVGPNYETNEQLAHVLLARGKKKEAEDLMRKGRRKVIASGDTSAIRNLIDIKLTHQIDLTGAEELAKAAVQIQPNSEQAWGHLGITQWKNRKCKDALQSIEHSLKLAPKCATWLIAHDMYAEQGNKKAAAYASSQANKLGRKQMEDDFFSGHLYTMWNMTTGKLNRKRVKGNSGQSGILLNVPHR